MSRKDSLSAGSEKKGRCYRVTAKEIWGEVDGSWKLFGNIGGLSGMVELVTDTLLRVLLEEGLASGAQVEGR